MNPSHQPLPDSAIQALEIWKEYQANHDVSDRLGQAVGIDRITRRVWFGKNAKEVVEAARADGVDNVLLCIRVGKSYYAKKGSCR